MQPEGTRTYGQYVLQDLLGRGGMGEVYRAYDTVRKRHVALKLLSPSLADEPRFAARFRRESYLAAQLSDPHIVPIHDFGEIDGRLFIDMRLVTGIDMGTMLERYGPTPPRLAVHILGQVASALGAAHAAGLIHRDVKPGNVMLTTTTRPDTQNPPFAYLVDFGIARSNEGQLTAFTGTSDVLGTLTYMAPERLRGAYGDERSDIYALACLLYESLVGSPPFVGEVFALMYSHVNDPPPRAGDSVPGIPAALDEVIARGMAKSPDARFQHARDFAAAATAALAAPSAASTQPRLPTRPDPDFRPPPPQGAPVLRGDPPAQRDPVPSVSSGPTRLRHQPAPEPPGPPGAPPPRRNRRARLSAVAATVLVALGGAIAYGVTRSGSTPTGGDRGTQSARGPTSSNRSIAVAPVPQSTRRGGVIYYADGDEKVLSWDPQRTYSAREIGVETRLFVRTLVQFGAGAGPGSDTIYPDLATNTGIPSDHDETWSFPLRTGVKWQDGSPVTCDDVKYGISRTFAQEIITGGPEYAIQFLAIPTSSDGGSAYQGPYDKTGQKYFDKAVTCSGNTITFHLKKPVPDFNYALTLPAFAPYRQAQDHGASSNYAVFSDGPYQLQGTWQPGTGGTFVRNSEYDPQTDNTSIRRALPDRFVFTEGGTADTIYQRLARDSGDDQTLVTDQTVPTANLGAASADGARFTDPTSDYVRYLAPNFTEMSSKLVREALAVSTNRSAWITAGGGSMTAAPAHAFISPQVGSAGGYKKFLAFDAPDSGNPAESRKLLAQAKAKTPYPLRIVYDNSNPLRSRQLKAMLATWTQAGFKVSLIPETAIGLFDLAQNRANSTKYDAVLSVWGPDWPDASTIIPPVFDGRIGPTNSANYGHYSSGYVNAKIDTAADTSDAATRNAIWGNLDEYLAKDVAYIPLAVDKLPRLHGSKVTNYVESAALGGSPDLGQLGAA